MVMQRWQFDWQQFHIERSTGWALAIAINALLLLMLTLPLRPVVPAESPDLPAPQIDWIPLSMRPPTPPAPPAPQPPPRPQPVISEVLRSPAPPLEQAVLQAAPLEQAPSTQSASQASPKASSSPGTVSAPAEAEARIDYDFAPLPPYPRADLMRGTQGTVLLRVRVDAEGRVQQVDIERSSGSRTLDRAAQQQVTRSWRFKPALRDGRPVAGWVRVPIEFSLDR